MRRMTTVYAALIAGASVFALSATSHAAGIQLKFGAFGSGKSPFYTRAIDPWAELVAKKTGGKVTVKKYLNTLGGARELYKNTRDGVADASWVAANGQRGFQFPRSEVAALPNILDGYTNQQANVALWRLYEKGLIKPDFSDVVPIGFASMSPVHVTMTDRVPTLSELKGVKLAVTSNIDAQVVKALGAIPVYTPITELYQVLSRKTADGGMIAFTAVKAFRLDEVTNRHILVPMDAPFVFIGMNKKKLDSLPGDARHAFLEASGVNLSMMLGRAADGTVAFTSKALNANPKQKLIQVPEADKEVWRKAVQPVIDDWVKATPNGAEILAGYKAQLAAAKKSK